MRHKKAATCCLLFISLVSTLVVQAQVPKAGDPIKSEFFENSAEYNKQLRESAKSGEFSKAINAAMQVQKSLDLSAYNDQETARIVGSAAHELIVNDMRGEQKTEKILEKMFLMQQVQISQNKLIIKLLSKLAYSK
ncbi:MAG: hypothetical protein DKT66_04860 [Candidatus Melainabacteria bacterium]|nr:MAG: hypothetical protein DKT66_04860 [Candidatus Melainabacteria bacterium]